MKTLLISLVFISLCSAQDISISGIVTDTGGMPVVGANVILESFGLNDTTGINGEFLITDAVTVNKIKQSKHYACAVKIFNGLLSVDVKKKSLIKIVVYTTQGRAVSEIRKSVDAGINSIALPNTSAGVYLYKIKIDNNIFVLKSNSISTVSTGKIISSSFTTVANHATTGEIVKVIKDGYFDYQTTIVNTNVSGIKIKLTIRQNMVVDIDGNAYHTVKIGTQEWMVSNLRTTRFNDGSPISIVTNDSAWKELTTPGYCYYDNTTDPDSIKKHGALYNQYVVNPDNPKKIAPAGWHVPTSAEWDILRDYLITNGFNWDETTEGNKVAKSLAANVDWVEPDTGIGAIGKDLSKNNKSGFTAFPTGYRSFLNGKFYRIGYEYLSWSSTKSTDPLYTHIILLCFDRAHIARGDGHNEFGLSIRLLQDSR